MKRPFWCLGWAALGLGVAAGLAVRECAPEPVHQGRPLRNWLPRLADEDHQERERAVLAIQAIGPAAVPGLVGILRDKSGAWDRFLAASRRRLSFLPSPALPSRQLRERAAEQLGALGRTDPKAVRVLVAALDEPDTALRAEIQCALRRASPASFGPLTEGLSAGKERVREGAAEALGDLAPAPEFVASALLRASKDRREAVRRAAVRSLGALAAKQGLASSGLAAALKDASASVRATAAEALGKAGIASHAELRGMEEMLADPDAMARIAAARALHQLDGRIGRVVPVLVGALRDRNAGWQAVFVLGEIGPRASSAVPALVEVLKKEKVFRPLRNPASSAVALGRIGPAAAPALAALLREGEPRVRAGAVIALGQIGVAAPETVPALRTALADGEPEVRQAAALALSALGLDAARVKRVLAEMVGDDDIFVSSAALSALAQMDPASALPGVD